MFTFLVFDRKLDDTSSSTSSTAPVLLPAPEASLALAPNATVNIQTKNGQTFVGVAQSNITTHRTFEAAWDDFRSRAEPLSPTTPGSPTSASKSAVFDDRFSSEANAQIAQLQHEVDIYQSLHLKSVQELNHAKELEAHRLGINEYHSKATQNTTQPSSSTNLLLGTTTTGDNTTNNNNNESLLQTVNEQQKEIELLRKQLAEATAGA
eukprot:TRINITY_DN3672_c0_g1_i1.p1 TRINITY_DN3672_c0_g1~~TRINITY_DN3672_c0_g1_i1.p1  ORF type:complete len:208 (+),score=11.75 TRINITY_DN3672_c0_g1_i1:63-686(+)